MENVEVLFLQFFKNEKPEIKLYFNQCFGETHNKSCICPIGKILLAWDEQYYSDSLLFKIVFAVQFISFQCFFFFLIDLI